MRLNKKKKKKEMKLNGEITAIKTKPVRFLEN